LMHKRTFGVAGESAIIALVIPAERSESRNPDRRGHDGNRISPNSIFSL